MPVNRPLTLEEAKKALGACERALRSAAWRFVEAKNPYPLQWGNLGLAARRYARAKAAHDALESPHKKGKSR